jgi:hypothetical protein
MSDACIIFLQDSSHAKYLQSIVIINQHDHILFGLHTLLYCMPPEYYHKLFFRSMSTMTNLGYVQIFTLLCSEYLVTGTSISQDLAFPGLLILCVNCEQLQTMQGH